MKRIFFLLLIFFGSLQAEDIPEPVVEIHAKLYTQIITYSSNFTATPSESMVIGVLYSGDLEEEAELFKQIILRSFPAGLKGKKIEVVLLPEASFAKFRSYLTAVYVLSNSQHTAKIIDELNKKTIITLAGSRSALANGALFGVTIAEKVSIVLNKKSFQSGKFILDQALMKKVKVYDAE